MGAREKARIWAGRELLRPYLRWLFYSFFPDRRPRYFLDCWKYPSCALSGSTPDAARLPEEPPPDLLFFPMTDWHARIQRTQHLAKAVAALGHRCFYVNPHLGCEYLRPYLADRGSRLSILQERILELHIHLPREHVFHRRLLSAGETRRIFAAVSELARAVRVQNAVQIVSFPIWWEASAALRERYGFPIVYDCHDFLGGFKNVAPDIVDKEAEVLEVADLVVFSSQPLLETTVAAFPAVREKALLVRNAVDAAHFAPAPTKAPSRQGRKLVGYAGSLDHWFDVEAVEEAVRRYPSWSFLLIGRVEDQRIRKLAAYSNVEFTGEVPYTELPRHMRRFDVAMIPFLRNSLTIAANPIKLYEYFSLGLPVVAARLPELERYSDLVYLADDPPEFAAGIGRAMEENDPYLRHRRLKVAEEESWLARANGLLKACGAPLAARPVPQA